MADDAAIESNGVQRQLGVLIGKMSEVVRRLNADDDSRRRMHERIEELGHDITEMRSAMTVEIRTLVDRVDDSEEVITAARGAIERFEKYEAGGKVAVSIVSVMGRPLGTLIKIALVFGAGVIAASWSAIFTSLTKGGGPNP